MFFFVSYFKTLQVGRHRNTLGLGVFSFMFFGSSHIFSGGVLGYLGVVMLGNTFLAFQRVTWKLR